MLFHQRNKRDVALRTRRHVRSESMFARRDSDRLHAGSRLARGRTVFVGTATHVSAPRSLSTWERAGRLADMIASHIELSIPDKQALLATLDPVRRLERVGDLLQGNA
jgi:hypothetical protein